MVQPNKSKKSGGIGPILFGLLFFGAGSFFMWFMALKPLVLSYQADQWPLVACTITHSTVDSRSDSDGTTYKAIVNFSYQINNQNYNGGSYNFNEAYSSGRSGKQRIVNQYRVGQVHECWVNPEKPSQAVVSRDIPGIVWFIIPFTSVFMIIGAAVMLGSTRLFSGLPFSRSKNTGHKRISVNQQGYTELQARYGVKKKLLGSIAITLFWNGIVSVFVYNIWQSFNSGNPEWGLLIFISIFVLVGFGLLIWVIYNLLSLSNPLPILHSTEGSPELGQDVQLSYTFTGNIKKIKQLTIVLEACEKATYTVGTDQRTDTNIFYKKELLNVLSPSEHMRQYTKVTIPANSMHSFSADSNEIEWQIKLTGDIAYWPDINYEYPLVIRPSSKKSR